jgi:cardiolipin synthase
MDNMQLVILGALAAAQRQVRIVTPYFLPDEAIAAALKTASLRGVAVDILVPERSNIFVMDWAMKPQFKDLLERGCRISLTPPPFDHAKIFVVDGLWSLIGSTNWDVRSLRLNFEYNLECYDSALAEHLNQLVDLRLRAGRQLTKTELDAQPLPHRFRDGLARLFTPYL